MQHMYRQPTRPLRPVARKAQRNPPQAKTNANGNDSAGVMPSTDCSGRNSRGYPPIPRTALGNNNIKNRPSRHPAIDDQLEMIFAQMVRRDGMPLIDAFSDGSPSPPKEDDVELLPWEVPEVKVFAPILTEAVKTEETITGKKSNSPPPSSSSSSSGSNSSDSNSISGSESGSSSDSDAEDEQKREKHVVVAVPQEPPPVVAAVAAASKPKLRIKTPPTNNIVNHSLVTCERLSDSEDDSCNIRNAKTSSVQLKQVQQHVDLQLSESESSSSETEAEKVSNSVMKTPKQVAESIVLSNEELVQKPKNDAKASSSSSSDSSSSSSSSSSCSSSCCSSSSDSSSSSSESEDEAKVNVKKDEQFNNVIKPVTTIVVEKKVVTSQLPITEVKVCDNKNAEELTKVTIDSQVSEQIKTFREITSDSADQAVRMDKPKRKKKLKKTSARKIKELISSESDSDDDVSAKRKASPMKANTLSKVTLDSQVSEQAKTSRDSVDQAVLMDKRKGEMKKLNKKSPAIIKNLIDSESDSDDDNLGKKRKASPIKEKKLKKVCVDSQVSEQIKTSRNSADQAVRMDKPIRKKKLKKKSARKTKEFISSEFDSDDDVSAERKASPMKDKKWKQPEKYVKLGNKKSDTMCKVPGKVGIPENKPVSSLTGWKIPKISKRVTSEKVSSDVQKMMVSSSPESLDTGKSLTKSRSKPKSRSVMSSDSSEGKVVTVKRERKPSYQKETPKIEERRNFEKEVEKPKSSIPKYDYKELKKRFIKSENLQSVHLSKEPSNNICLKSPPLSTNKKSALHAIYGRRLLNGSKPRVCTLDTRITATSCIARRPGNNDELDGCSRLANLSKLTAT